MKNSISIGCTPLGENCIQVNPEIPYLREMRQECNRYVIMLIRRFPDCKKVSFKVKECRHDFGTYLDVEVWYEEEESDSENQAFFIEGNLPEKWTDTEVLHFSI